VNYNTSSVYPPYILAKQYGDFQNWILAVHYLSICAGAEIGSEDLTPIILKCQPKLGGFKFRTDDPFIVDFWAEGSEYPVIDDTSLETFDTAPAFVTFIIGLVFSFLSTVVLVGELFGWSQRSYVPQLGVCLLAVSSIVLLRSGKNSLLSARVNIYDDIFSLDHQCHNAKQWILDVLSDWWNTSKLDANFPLPDVVGYSVYLCGFRTEAGGCCGSEGEKEAVVDDWPDLRKYRRVQGQEQEVSREGQRKKDRSLDEFISGAEEKENYGLVNGCGVMKSPKQTTDPCDKRGP
jgi:hypothetical protein